MRVDFHLHTSEYSRCAAATPREQIRAAIDAGVDVVFITEHMKVFPVDKIERLRKKSFQKSRSTQGLKSLSRITLTMILSSLVSETRPLRNRTGPTKHYMTL